MKSKSLISYINKQKKAIEENYNTLYNVNESIKSYIEKIKLSTDFPNINSIINKQKIDIQTCIDNIGNKTTAFADYVKDTPEEQVDKDYVIGLYNEVIKELCKIIFTSKETRTIGIDVGDVDNILKINKNVDVPYIYDYFKYGEGIIADFKNSKASKENIKLYFTIPKNLNSINIPKLKLDLMPVFNIDHNSTSCKLIYNFSNGKLTEATITPNEGQASIDDNNFIYNLYMIFALKTLKEEFDSKLKNFSSKKKTQLNELSEFLEDIKEKFNKAKEDSDESELNNENIWEKIAEELSKKNQIEVAFKINSDEKRKEVKDYFVNLAEELKNSELDEFSLQEKNSNKLKIDNIEFSENGGSAYIILKNNWFFKKYESIPTQEKIENENYYYSKLIEGIMGYKENDLLQKLPNTTIKIDKLLSKKVNLENLSFKEVYNKTKKGDEILFGNDTMTNLKKIFG